MPSVDLHDVNLKIVADLQSQADIKAIIGDPVRVYIHTPREAKYPWCRMENLAGGMLTGSRNGAGPPDWIYEHVMQFSIFENTADLTNVAEAMRLISDRMEAAPDNITGTFPEWTITHSLPGARSASYDSVNRHAMAFCVFTFHLEGT